MHPMGFDPIASTRQFPDCWKLYFVAGTRLESDRKISILYPSAFPCLDLWSKVLRHYLGGYFLGESCLFACIYHWNDLYWCIFFYFWLYALKNPESLSLSIIVSSLESLLTFRTTWNSLTRLVICSLLCCHFLIRTASLKPC